MLCANCNNREGTICWIGDGGALAYVHGMYSMWCELCATIANLDYAKKQANLIPELEKKIKELEQS